MSVDKLLAQAEKLLDKGKTEEALVKLQTAFSQDSNNELVANKLARLYLSIDQRAEAVAIYKTLGSRATAAGKSQKALAMYRQGLDIDPENLELLERLSPECEAVGKVSEAAGYAQRVLAFYIPRKRYLDALSTFALLARVQPSDEGIRLAWLELLMYVRHEEHLRKALVCLCGPPGISFDEFKIGGDPTKLSASLYQGMVNLKPFYPADPVLPYALAWIAYRQGRQTEAFKYLAESFKRGPTFTLSVLLFAKMLAEKERLPETLFVYKFAKDIIAVDRSVDLRSLAQQMANFEEKNGWLNFADGFGGGGGDLEPSDFIDKFLPEGALKEKRDEEDTATATLQANEMPDGVPDLFGHRKVVAAPETPLRKAAKEEARQAAMPQEVELGMPAAEEEASIVIQFTGDATRVVDRNQLAVESSKPSPRASFITPIPTEEAAPEESAPAPTPAKEDATKMLSPLELLDAQKHKNVRHRRYRKAVRAPEERVVPPQEHDQEATKVLVRDSKPAALEPSAVASEQEVDLGDDLLDQPTKHITQAPTAKAPDKIKEPIKATVKAIVKVKNPVQALLRNAERLISKRSFFLARKLFRVAEKLGADPKIVSEKLHTIRDLEFPDGLFKQASSDASDEHDNLIRSLERDLDSGDEDQETARQLGDAVQKIRPKIEESLSDADPRVRLDLGIAFLEMGLFAEAANQFSLAATDSKLFVEGTYLEAQALFKLGDFPAAVTLLKKLCSDLSLKEADKLPFYYLLAEIYEEMQQPKRSKKYFQKVSDLDNNYRSVREKLGTN